MTIPTTYPQRFSRNTTNSRQPLNPNTERQVSIVGGYELQERLGSGSFATVYKGVQYNDQRQPLETVAIKAISRTSDKLTPKVLENLELEILILRTYRHANIVCLHHVQKTNTYFNLILEYCAGGDVQRIALD